MISEFIKDHKKLCIITLIIIVILILIIVNKNSSSTEDTISDSVEEINEDYEYYEEEIDTTEELDETQSTRYNDINYGTEE